MLSKYLVNEHLFFWMMETPLYLNFIELCSGEKEFSHSPFFWLPGGLDSYYSELLSSVKISSVVQLHMTLWDPMDYSTPGFPIHHQLPEFTQTHVHPVGDGHPTISSSVIPFSSCLQSFSASGSFPMSTLRIRWPKYWSFSFSTSLSNEYSGLVSFRMD